MSILTASNLTKRFGIVELFSNLTLSIHEKERVALIGANGCGKTTLLKMLIGEESCSDNGEDKKPGTIALMKEKTIGYLSQKVITNIEHSLMEEILDVFTYQIQLNEQFETLTEKMSQGEVDDKLSERYDKLLVAMEDSDAFSYLYQIKAILTRFGFNEQDYERKIASFSGGERTKISLAKLILTRPDLLILDEPTNHLDVSMIEWLTKFLNNYQGAILFVSHDRYFIDDVATRIIELENNILTSYSGNYEQYVIEKKNHADLLLRQFKIQQKEIARLEWFIKYYKPKPRFTSRAKDREKKLAKIERISLPKTSTNKLKLALDTPLKVKKRLAYFDDISLGYEDVLVQPFSFYLFSDQKVAVMGDNGTGKSTFLKAILGDVKLKDGSIEFFRRLNIAYLKQNDFDFNPTHTPYTVINTLRPMKGKTWVRTHLGRFGFYGDDVFKSISHLSGGELMRLNLARLVLEDYELLLLDEPTNNLDLMTKDALIDALKQYKGALIVVSHDRYLVNEVCNHILYFHHGEALMVEGDYQDLKEQLIDEPSTQVEKTVNHSREKVKLTHNARMKLEDEQTAIEHRLRSIEVEEQNESRGIDYEKLTTLADEKLNLEHRLLDILTILDDGIE